MNRIIKKSAIIGVLLFGFSGIISCEKDFSDIGTSIISNSKFTAKDTVLEVIVTQRDIDAIRADNLSVGSIGEYLLGVYEPLSGDYEKIEASFVSQIGIATIGGLSVTEGVTDSTTVTSVLESAFVKLPYIATKGANTANGVPTFTLDSVLGNTNSGVSLKVYRNNTFLHSLNPQNPSQGFSYKSDVLFDKGVLLNKDPNFVFIPNSNDTIHTYDRTLSTGSTFKDTLKLTNANPFLVIPLDKALVKTIFYDKFADSEFSSQDALNNYFRGLLIEASGSENSLVPFVIGSVPPTLEVIYTNTVIKTSTGQVMDTINKSASFILLGNNLVNSRLYKMTPETNVANANQVVVQGTAGKVADVKLFQGNQLQALRAKNWLINDASLTFYIDASKDTLAVPQRLFLFKNETNGSSQIKDTYTEGLERFSGVLIKENANNDRYNFRITDYISDVLGPNSAKNSDLVLRVHNTTDNPLLSQTLDTVVSNYNWNPRAVTIKNHLPSNGTIIGTRKAQLKISYSEKK